MGINRGAIGFSKGEKKQCSKGYCCGASCIQQSKACEGNELGGQQKEHASYLAQHAPGGGAAPAPAKTWSAPPPAPPFSPKRVESPELAKFELQRMGQNADDRHERFNPIVSVPGALSVRVELLSHRESTISANDATVSQDLKGVGRSLRLAADGMLPDNNGLIIVGEVRNAMSSFVDKTPAGSLQDRALAAEKAIVCAGREGDLVLIPDDPKRDTPAQIEIRAELQKRMLLVSGEDSNLLKTESIERSGLIGKIQEGRIVPLDAEDFKKAKLGSEVRDLRQEQMSHVYDAHSGDDDPDRTRDDIFRSEDEVARSIAPIEDAWMGRKPTPGSVPTEAQYKARAREWAQAQGFDDSGANGFTAAQTRAHDIAHPITHDLLGMNSLQINQALGNLQRRDGKPSLLGEEAIVNVVEHLSRGDSLENSITNGMRLARALSRDNVEGNNGRTYFRSKEFKDSIGNLANQIYRNDNFSEYMNHVRSSNQASSTVTAAGDDF